MKPELDQIALRYAGKLFPDFLYIIENTHDYNYVKRNESAFNDKLIYDYIINDYRLLNLNKEQTEYIFKIIETKYSKFLQKQWYEFNSITSKFYKQDNKAILPDDLHFLNDKNYIEQIRNYIEANKLKLIDNFKKVREYIFITRPKEMLSTSNFLNNMLYDLTKPKEYSNEEINEYMQKWVDMTITIDDWLNHKRIDFEEELKHWSLTDEELQKILQHKFNLFNEFKNRIVKNRLIDPFEMIISQGDKLITAKRDLDLIENLIYGKIDEIKEKRLNQTFYIKDWKTTATHFDYIFRNKYKNEHSYDIHHADSFLDALIITSYRRYLNYFLDSLNDTKEIVKVKTVNNDIDNNNIIPEVKMKFVLKMLEDLSVTSNGKSNLSERKKGAIRGIVLALREENLLPNLSIEILISNIANKIGLEINSKLDSSKVSDGFEKKARKYIKENPF